jgi:hypothetical protein
MTFLSATQHMSHNTNTNVVMRTVVFASGREEDATIRLDGPADRAGVALARAAMKGQP